MAEFAIDPGIDAHAIAELFRANGRVQISDFLSPESAIGLFENLRDSKAWRLTANRGDQVLNLRPELLATFGDAEWAKLRNAITLGGRSGFQFHYDTIRLDFGEGEGDESTSLLSDFTKFMSSPHVVEVMRTVTGDDAIEFADAHASRYSPGHFLAAHDDRADGMGRRAAYVLNLTSNWRPDWGGILLFHDAQGNIVRGFTPGFNTLNIFRVPQQHSVSLVTPLAAHPRYAVTGWLRSCNGVANNLGNC